MAVPDVSWIEFDVHGYASLRVARTAPSAAIFREMFEPFSVEGLQNFDLTITETAEEIDNPAYADDRYRYSSSAVYLKTARTQVVLDGAGCFHLSGKGELLTSALPIMDVILARRGAAMIHAAAFEYRGYGIALPAWGGTGKTSVLAELLVGAEEGSFMGDDWAFVSDDGRLLGFAKPIFIKPHHRLVYPHLFVGRRKPMVPAAFSTPMSRIATAAHPLVTRFPRLAAFSRRWSPEHMMVRPAKAFSRISPSAPLGAIIFMERFAGNELVLEERGAEWMASRLIGNFYAELSGPSRQVFTALGATALVPLHEPFAQKHALLTRALEAKPVFLLRIPRSMPPNEASGQVARQIMRAVALAGVA